MVFFRHTLLRSIACVFLACGALSGCGSKEARVQEAYGRYQSASAANDMVGAQQALLELVAIDDRVAEYWVELARIQAAAGSTGDAYHSLTRAHELDRGNVEILRALTELALRGGDPASAQMYARELEIVSPGDRWVKLTAGYGALREERFEEALAASDAVLLTSPLDSHAKVLKARALLGKKQEADAVKLLVDQVQKLPTDVISLQLIASIYGLRKDWSRLFPVASRLAALQPANYDHAVLAIEAAFETGQWAEGRTHSINLMKPGTDISLISKVLEIWMRNWVSPDSAALALKLGIAARTAPERIPYADFLNRIGSPTLALKLVAAEAKYPIVANNANANAVAADSLFRNGRPGAAAKRFAAVLAFDAGNSIALRGRSNMLIRLGKAADAIEDAEKLVTVAPESAQDRLLLARVYTAAGDPQQSQRVLWDAFRNIPADEQIYGALAQLARSSPGQSLTLKKEFDRQIVTKLSQGQLL